MGTPLLVSHEVIEAAGGDWACHADEPVAEAVRGIDHEVVLFPIVIEADTSAASTASS